MARIIRCECGFVARGDTDDELMPRSAGIWPRTIPPSSRA